MAMLPLPALIHEYRRAKEQYGQAKNNYDSFPNPNTKGLLDDAITWVHDVQNRLEAADRYHREELRRHPYKYPSVQRDHQLLEEWEEFVISLASPPT